MSLLPLTHVTTCLVWQKLMAPLPSITAAMRNKNGVAPNLWGSKTEAERATCSSLESRQSVEPGSENRHLGSRC